MPAEGPTERATAAGGTYVPRAAFETVDVVVVGAGRAGLAAATEAAGGGASVLCVERDDEVGGKLNQAARAGDVGAARQCAALRDAAREAGVRIVTGAGVFGVFALDDEPLTAAIYDTAAGVVRAVRARRVIVATGNAALWHAAAGAAVPGLSVVGSAAIVAAAGAARDAHAARDEWSVDSRDTVREADQPTVPLFPVPIEALAAFADRARFGAGRPTLTLDVG